MPYRCNRKTGQKEALLAFCMVMIVVVEGLSAPADAKTDPLQILQTESEAIAIHLQTQKTEDRWVAEKTVLLSRYRTLQAEEKTLAKQHAALKAQVLALGDRKAESERTVAEIARVAEEMQPHLETLVDHLETHMGRDLPFLPTERNGRMAEIKSVLAQSDTTIAEKSRRVMEAMRIETEYGQTVEVYQQAIPVGGRDEGQEIMADILRVGRLALFWRSPDGRAVGQWDRVNNTWTRLPDTYRRTINDAVEMAFKRRTIDMVNLPLGRIAQQ